MADFDAAFPVVLKHEGGFISDPNDPGGATNYGVSLRWLKGQGLLGDMDHDGDVDTDDIRLLTVNTAKQFYKINWWDRYGYNNFFQQEIATKVFDTAVNVGAKKAHQFLQQAFNVWSNNKLIVDGLLGSKTYQAVNDSGYKTTILSSYQEIQANYYRALVQNNPKFTKFLRGWLNRAYDR